MELTRVAELMNGKEYRKELSDADNTTLAQLGIVVVFGASDDLMEFRGAIYGEVGCYDGGFAYLDENGLIERECEDEDCPHEEKKKANAVTIEALWCPNDKYSWTYKTKIPHESFDIIEDGGLYCRGICFYLSSIKKTQELILEESK